MTINIADIKCESVRLNQVAAQWYFPLGLLLGYFEISTPFPGCKANTQGYLFRLLFSDSDMVFYFDCLDLLQVVPPDFVISKEFIVVAVR